MWVLCVNRVFARAGTKGSIGKGKGKERESIRNDEERERERDGNGMVWYGRIPYHACCLCV